ncbi:MAG: hypothetical protein F6K21_30590 [Symploca sp. SIO2D2]|nr:hypothetical protein [Symploca sp. SIO2D2]
MLTYSRAIAPHPKPIQSTDCQQPQFSRANFLVIKPLSLNPSNLNIFHLCHDIIRVVGIKWSI